MTFGDDWGWGTAKDEARKVYDAFREAGGNFIDTTNLYTKRRMRTLISQRFSEWIWLAWSRPSRRM